MDYSTRNAQAPTYLSTMCGVAANAQIPGSGSTVGTITWVANLAMFIPIYVPAPFPINRWFVAQDTTAGTFHYDVGIYTADGTLLVSAGDTAVAGNQGNAYIAGPGTLLTPGRYYLAMSHSSTHAYGIGATLTAAQWSMAGVMEQTGGAFPLPATMTGLFNFAVPTTRAFYPLFGITRT